MENGDDMGGSPFFLKKKDVFFFEKMGKELTFLNKAAHKRGH
jgi:hypothetical protein